MIDVWRALVRRRPMDFKPLLQDPRKWVGSLLGRPGQKFGREMGCPGRKVRMGTDLPRKDGYLFGRIVKFEFFSRPVGPNRLGARKSGGLARPKLVRTLNRHG